MRKWILVVLLAGPITAQADTVFLSGEGSIRKVHGTIIREVPGVSVSIRTYDGQELLFAADDIANILREDASSILQNDSPPFATPMRTYREPSTALLYSVLIPGGGQFYNGEAGKGLLQLSGAIGGVVIFFANLPRYDYYGFETESGDASMATAGIGIALVSSIWSIVDAPASARKFNREQGFAQLQPVIDGKCLGIVARWSF